MMIKQSITRRVNKRLIKPMVRRFDRYQENYDHKMTAYKAIRAFEESNSQKLSPIHKKLSDQYALDVFGTKDYAPWLYFYSLIRGEFLEGWIPDNYFGQYIAPNQGLPIVSLYKTFSSIVLKSHLLPDLAYFIDGKLYDHNYCLIESYEFQRIYSSIYPEIFIKADKSNQGKAVYKFGLNNLDESSLLKIGNCVIQAPIQQHIFFDEIIQGRVASLRIITVRNKQGKVESRASHVDFGRKNDVGVKGADFFQVPIIGENGELNPYGLTSDQKKWSYHPDSKISIENKKIPNYKNAVEECIRLHTKLPHFNVVGWDIAINMEGKIQLMEWNAIYPGIKLDEAVYGPCFTGLGWENVWRNGVN